MKKIVVNNKYNYKDDYCLSDIDYSELVTVPDQVLSMRDIYMKYAVTGEIAGLSSGNLPRVSDNFDLDDPNLDFVPEEDVDILHRAKLGRMQAQFALESAAKQSDRPLVTPKNDSEESAEEERSDDDNVSKES